MDFFESLMKDKDVQLNSEQLRQFQIYYSLLVEWNEKINLTAITDQREVYLKHFYDSLIPSFIHDFHSVNSLCDVGAGAGFPSLPLKILFPHLKITIVDSLKKRILFLETLVEALNLKDVHLFHDRAETFGHLKEMRESFDVVTARAVAKLNVLSEFCLPLTKVNGFFIALKGALGEEEVEDSKNAIKLLGGRVDSFHTFSLPQEEAQRQLIVIKKTNTSPAKYPRKPGIPVKQPL